MASPASADRRAAAEAQPEGMNVTRTLGRWAAQSRATVSTSCGNGGTARSPDVKHTTATPCGDVTSRLVHSMSAGGAAVGTSALVLSMTVGGGSPFNSTMCRTACCVTSAWQSSVAAGCSSSTTAPPQRSSERAASAELQREFSGASTAPTAVTANSASRRHLWVGFGGAERRQRQRAHPLALGDVGRRAR